MRNISCLTLLFLSTLLQAGEGRYESYTQWAAKGEKLTPVTATYYGGGGCEEFVRAIELADGSIIAMGNAWGPEAPDAKATVWGAGVHSGKPAIKEEKKKEKDVEKITRKLDLESPDRSGFVVWFAPKLAAVNKSARFDWGVATIFNGAVSKSGEVYLCGRCGPAFSSLNVPGEGDSFLMKLKEQTPQWIVRFGASKSAANKLYLDDHGVAYVQSEQGKQLELWKVEDSGQATRLIEQKRANTGNFQAVSNEGIIYYGDDRNTNTGKEPWRQPFYYIYDKTGKKEKTLWEWEPKGLRRDGAPGNGEVSDSSPRVTTIDPKTGDLLIYCWSDGGNAVLRYQPTDLAKPGPKAANGMETYGMKGANSLCWILRLDAKSYELKQWTYWQAFFPADFSVERLRNSPNGCKIKDMAVLPDGALGFCGGAATGLIQTPNSFWTYAKDGKGYGGDYVTVLSADFKEIRYSAYLPGVEEASVSAGASGLLVAGRSKGKDGNEPPTKSPSVGAIQGELRGEYDGWLMLLK